MFNPKLSDLLLDHADQEGAMYVEADTAATLIKMAQELEKKIEFLERIAKKGLEGSDL